MFFDDYRHGASVAADLVNTVGSISGYDHVPDKRALRAWLEAHEIASPASITERDMEAVRELRERLREVFEAGSSPRSIDLINELLREMDASPQVVEDDAGFRIALLPHRDSAADRLAAVTVTGLAAMVGALGPDRLGLCEADDCEDAYADTSRNGSRRFCSESCGTRTHVAAYRARKQEMR